MSALLGAKRTLIIAAHMSASDPKRTWCKSLSFYFLYPPLKKTPVFIIQMADYSSVAIWLVGVWRLGAIAMTSKTSAGVYKIVGKGAAGGPDEILGY